MAMSWTQRMKRVFNIDIENCEKCQGPVRIISCIEDPVAIRQILDHLASNETSAEQATLPPGRAPRLNSGCLMKFKSLIGRKMGYQGGWQGRA